MGDVCLLGTQRRTYEEVEFMDIATMIEMELAYKRTFADVKPQDWGYLFRNAQNPAHWDANHAWILNEPEDYESVRQAVEAFYAARGIVPRFYVFDWKSKEGFVDHLSSKGYRTEMSVDSVQLWSGILVETSTPIDVRIEVVTLGNYQDAMHVECGILEFGGREVRERAFALEFQNPHYKHFLLRCDGEPAGTACIFQHDGNARVESVAFLKPYRGRGFVKVLLRRIQEEAEACESDKLWIFPMNETVANVYERCGFETVGHLESAHVYHSCPSMKDVAVRAADSTEM